MYQTNSRGELVGERCSTITRKGWKTRVANHAKRNTAPPSRILRPEEIQSRVRTIRRLASADLRENRIFFAALDELCSVGVEPSEIASRLRYAKKRDVLSWKLGTNPPPESKRARIIQTALDILELKGVRLSGARYGTDTGLRITV